MRKFGVFVLIIMSIFFLCLSVYYHLDNISLQRSLSEVSNRAKEDFKAAVIKERELIRRDLDEKYRADLVSFEAMAKRVELEKKKVKELQEKIRDLGTK